MFLATWYRQNTWRPGCGLEGQGVLKFLQQHMVA